MNGTLSNQRRTFVATARRGPASLAKGNRYTTSTARTDARDMKPSFPQVAFGRELPYTVRPYVEIDGIFFDIEAPVKRTRKPARTRRQDPGAGRRPSLSTIRSK